MTSVPSISRLLMSAWAPVICMVLIPSLGSRGLRALKNPPHNCGGSEERSEPSGGSVRYGTTRMRPVRNTALSLRRGPWDSATETRTYRNSFSCHGLEPAQVEKEFRLPAGRRLGPGMEPVDHVVEADLPARRQHEGVAGVLDDVDGHRHRRAELGGVLGGVLHLEELVAVAELEEDRHLDVADDETGRLLADGEDLPARGVDGGLRVSRHHRRGGVGG